MKAPIIFIAGVVTGVILERRRFFAQFSDKCMIPECGYTTRAFNPQVVISNMQQHHKNKHPGWPDSRKLHGL